MIEKRVLVVVVICFFFFHILLSWTALIRRERSFCCARSLIIIVYSTVVMILFSSFYCSKTHFCLGPSSYFFFLSLCFLRIDFVYLFRIAIHMDFAQIPNQCAIETHNSVGYLILKIWRQSQKKKKTNHFNKIKNANHTTMIAMFNQPNKCKVNPKLRETMSKRDIYYLKHQNGNNNKNIVHLKTYTTDEEKKNVL